MIKGEPGQFSPFHFTVEFSGFFHEQPDLAFIGNLSGGGFIGRFAPGGLANYLQD